MKKKKEEKTEKTEKTEKHPLFFISPYLLPSRI